MGIFDIFDMTMRPIDKIAEFMLKPVDYLEERPILIIIIIVMILISIFTGVLIYKTVKGGGIYDWFRSASDNSNTPIPTTSPGEAEQQLISLGCGNKCGLQHVFQLRKLYARPGL